MDHPDEPGGRRPRSDTGGAAGAFDETLSPTERLERLRQGLNRGQQERAALRQVRRAADDEPVMRGEPPATRGEPDVGGPRAPDPTPRRSSNRPAPPSAGGGDDGAGEAVVSSFEEDAPAPREKARWRAGTGPRAAQDGLTALRSRRGAAEAGDPPPRPSPPEGSDAGSTVRDEAGALPWEVAAAAPTGRTAAEATSERISGDESAGGDNAPAPPGSAGVGLRDALDSIGRPSASRARRALGERKRDAERGAGRAAEPSERIEPAAPAHKGPKNRPAAPQRPIAGAGASAPASDPNLSPTELAGSAAEPGDRYTIDRSFPTSPLDQAADDADRRRPRVEAASARLREEPPLRDSGRAAAIDEEALGEGAPPMLSGLEILGREEPTAYRDHGADGLDVGDASRDDAFGEPSLDDWTPEQRRGDIALDGAGEAAPLDRTAVDPVPEPGLEPVSDQISGQISEQASDHVFAEVDERAFAADEDAARGAARRETEAVTWSEEDDFWNEDDVADERADGRRGGRAGASAAATASLPATVSIDTVADSAWDETPEVARERAFHEAAREVEQRRALKANGSRPFSLEERMLAGRYLRARRKEGFISVIAALSFVGIALGVAILIIVMSVMNGFRAELVSKIIGVNGHLTVISLSNDFTDFRDIADRIRAVPGVTRAAPLVEAQAFANAPRSGTGVVVRGVTKEDLLTLEKVSVSPEYSFGSLSNFEGDGGVAIGQRLALKLGLNVGDNLTLISPRGATTPFGVMPRKKSYRIVYVFKVGMSHFDEGVVFMPLFEAQKFFNKNGGVDAIEVMVATPERLSGYREDIEVAAGRQIVIGDWIESNRSLIGALKTERTVMFLILSFLILIASLIIIAGMIMLVKEKGKDIAILRTMGMTQRAVMRIFFMCGASIGFAGTLAGVAIGLVFCANIDQIADAVSFLANGDVFPEDVYLLSKLPAQVHTEDVVMTVGISLGLSFLATLYPAWRAARLDPVEALRYE